MQDQSDLLQQLKLDKTSPPVRRYGAIWATVGAVVLVIGAYFLGAQHIGSPQVPPDTPSKTPPVSDRTQPKESDTRAAISSRKVLDASGYVTARQLATVSAEIMGLILSIDVDEGMYVEKGQVLAHIDDTVAQIQLRLAKAATETQRARIDSLNVDLSEAERELQRIVSLGVTGDFASKAQLTRAQAAVDRLKANIRSARADLEVTELQILQQQDYVNDHRIRAPFAGVVTAKNAQAGEIVSPSSAGGGFTRTGICTIVDMQSLEIEVDVNESFIGRVKEEQTVVAVLDAYPDWQIPAEVIAVIPTADRAKATVSVRIKIKEKDSRILPNMGVKVSFLDEEGSS